MAVCIREFPDGRVCRERGPVLDSRPIRYGRIQVTIDAVQACVVECPKCGPRIQLTLDVGPSPKRYVPSRNSERRRNAAALARQRLREMAARPLTRAERRRRA
jgi:hypothetical protein